MAAWGEIEKVIFFATFSLYQANFTRIVKYYLNLKFLEVIKVAELPIAAVSRIAKKNGAERVGSDAVETLVVKAGDYITRLAKEVNKFAVHAGRKTIKEEDVDLAARSV